jgi:hypothetical protein
MWWQALDDIAANLFAWLISEKGGDMIGVGVLVIIGIVAVIRWHRRQRAAKKLGMASWPFIAACFAIALIAVGAGGYGLGLRGTAKPNLVELQGLDRLFSGYDQPTMQWVRRLAATDDRPDGVPPEIWRKMFFDGLVAQDRWGFPLGLADDHKEAVKAWVNAHPNIPQANTK